MNLVGVSTLFITPTMRTSNYLSLLSEALVSLSSTKPSIPIDDPALPTLQNLVVVDNMSKTSADLRQFQSEMAKVPAAIDFREVFKWEEGQCASKTSREIIESLNPDEIINLQFTRFVASFPASISH